VVKTAVTVPRDVDLFGITPHAHYLATDMQATAYLPDGTAKPLIRIKDWDFNWQGQYRYKEPVHLPQGTRIEIQYVYDNSDRNPHNPSHPPVRVTWGEETRDEMALLFLVWSFPRRPTCRSSDTLCGINTLQRSLLKGTVSMICRQASLPTNENSSKEPLTCSTKTVMENWTPANRLLSSNTFVKLVNSL
jgi:hypothetical protein